jgi:sulfotransferase family protein
MTGDRLAAMAERLVYTARSFSWIVDPRVYWPDGGIVIDRPIFLVGTQGGGLTLLSRMLRRHPDVVSATGNCQYWTSADEMQNTFGPMLPAELTGVRFKAPPHPVLTAPRSWTYASRDLYAVYRKRAEDATPELASVMAQVIRGNIQRHAFRRRSARFVDKSQSFSVRAGLVWALLKDYHPHFVLVPRDPYVSVYRAAMGKAGDMKRLTPQLSYEERVDICAEHYANTMRATLEDADRHGFPLKIVRFETLIADTAATLREVCDFAGLSFHEDMLPAAHHRLPYGSRYRDRWYPIRAEVNAVYQSRIDAATIARVNFHGADVFPRLGYAVR